MTLNAYSRFRSVKRSNRAMSWNAWDIATTLFPVLRVFWRNNMVSAVGNTSWKPLETPFPPFASALKNFGTSSKALPTIHYQPATQKLFDSPGQYNLARMLKNSPGPPCAPSFFKSRRFRILPIRRKKNDTIRYAEEFRVPSRVPAFGPKPCGGNQNITLYLPKIW